MHWLTGTLAHVVFGLAAVLVYVVMTRAYAERRPPSTAIAWVMGLALLPYLALPLYFLFGRRKETRSRLAHASEPLPDGAPWAAQLACAFGIAPPRAGDVRFDADGLQALASMHALIESAHKRLDVATFVLGGSDDAVAQGLVQAMAAAASRGVRVRLLLDGLGSRRVKIAALAAWGIQAKRFRPPFGRPGGSPRNLRNHRKLIVADGERLWGGGRNLAREYFEAAPGAPAWQDLSFRVDGNVAADAARLFERDWQDRSAGAPPAAASPVADSSPVVDPPDRADVQLLPSGPDMPEDCAHAVLVGACFRAERTIVAISPYFVPDDALAQALHLTAVRGVQVDILVPAVSNHRLADIARARAMRDLAAAGVRFHLLPGMAHAKAFVVDDALAACGSTNLDPRSLFLNRELSLLFYGSDEIAWLSEWLRRRIGEAERYRPDSPGFGRDLVEGIVRAVAFQL
jgi:cardiolipin synthase